MRTSTLCVQLPRRDDPYGAVAPPIYQTAAFRQPGALEFGEYDYSRTANPTRSLTEEQIALLEGGRFACAFASGMAALVAVTRLVRAGEEILAGDDLYGGTCRLLSQVAPRHGVQGRYVDGTDPRAVGGAGGGGGVRPGHPPAAHRDADQPAAARGRPLGPRRDHPPPRRALRGGQLA